MYFQPFSTNILQLLHTAFQDLARAGKNRSNFLADHPAREMFARGLVEVLDRDVKRRERFSDRRFVNGTPPIISRTGGFGNNSLTR